MEQLEQVRSALAKRGKALAVAKATGLSVSTVYRLRDPSVNPSLGTLLTVAAHLELERSREGAPQ